MGLSKNISIASMVLFPTVFAVIDIALALNDTEGDTYSEIIRHLWWQAPVVSLPFIAFFGVLLGHWFKPPEEHEGPAHGLLVRYSRTTTILIFAMVAGISTCAFVLAGAFWW